MAARTSMTSAGELELRQDDSEPGERACRVTLTGADRSYALRIDSAGLALITLLDTPLDWVTFDEVTKAEPTATVTEEQAVITWTVSMFMHRLPVAVTLPRAPEEQDDPSPLDALTRRIAVLEAAALPRGAAHCAALLEARVTELEALQARATGGQIAALLGRIEALETSIRTLEPRPGDLFEVSMPYIVENYDQTIPNPLDLHEYLMASAYGAHIGYPAYVATLIETTKENALYRAMAGCHWRVLRATNFRTVPRSNGSMRVLLHPGGCGGACAHYDRTAPPNPEQCARSCRKACHINRWLVELNRALDKRRARLMGVNFVGQFRQIIGIESASAYYYTLEDPPIVELARTIEIKTSRLDDLLTSFTCGATRSAEQPIERHYPPMVIYEIASRPALDDEKE